LQQQQSAQPFMGNIPVRGPQYPIGTPLITPEIVSEQQQQQQHHSYVDGSGNMTVVSGQPPLQQVHNSSNNNNNNNMQQITDMISSPHDTSRRTSTSLFNSPAEYSSPPAALYPSPWQANVSAAPQSASLYNTQYQQVQPPVSQQQQGSHHPPGNTFVTSLQGVQSVPGVGVGVGVGPSSQYLGPSFTGLPHPNNNVYHQSGSIGVGQQQQQQSYISHHDSRALASSNHLKLEPLNRGPTTNNSLMR
jgi:hypothetical protein